MLPTSAMMISSPDPKDDLKYNNNVLSVKVTTTIWFVLFLSVVVGITTKLEARLFSAHNSKSFFTVRKVFPVSPDHLLMTSHNLREKEVKGLL